MKSMEKQAYPHNELLQRKCATITRNSGTKLQTLTEQSPALKGSGCSVRLKTGCLGAGQVSDLWQAEMLLGRSNVLCLQELDRTDIYI